ncbi:TPA: hypothetical protein SAX33_000792 [Bacillus cereus]|nr:hypothetical protein [Bacillus cereus]
MVKVTYSFETKRDFIDYLGSIVEKLQKYLWRIKHYNKNLKTICLDKYKEAYPNISDISPKMLIDLINHEEYSSKKEIFKPIPYYKFMKLDDSVNFVNLKILNIIGDRTKEAASYRKFLDQIKEYNKKQDPENLIQLSDLSQNLNELLNQCYKSRNYKAHIGDSVLISQNEYRKKQLDDYTQQTGLNVTRMKEQTKHVVIVNRYEYADIDWLFGLYLTTNNNIDLYTTIFQQIRRDYSKLVGEKTIIEPFPNRILPYNYAKITNDSIAMQFTKPKKKKQ